MSTMFGQFVIGPPGSGKTTYCKVMSNFLQAQGRQVVVVNLDPANHILPYVANIDISELITLEDAMEAMKLGPNGGLIFCMEYLEKNLDWLITKLKSLPPTSYVLCDCPGQIELYTHHAAVRNLLHQVQSQPEWHFAAVHLVDSQCCSEASKFISVLCTSLSSMLHLEMPCINILSKADLIDTSQQLPFSVEYFSEVGDLSYLLDYLQEDPFYSRYQALNKALIGVIEDRSLVSYHLLDIQDKESLTRVLKAVDKANGCTFGTGEERSLNKLMSSVVPAESGTSGADSVQEKYVHHRSQDDLDEMDFFS